MSIQLKLVGLQQNLKYQKKSTQIGSNGAILTGNAEHTRVTGKSVSGSQEPSKALTGTTLNARLFAVITRIQTTGVVRLAE